MYKRGLHLVFTLVYLTRCFSQNLESIMKQTELLQQTLLETEYGTPFANS